MTEHDSARMPYSVNYTCISGATLRISCSGYKTIQNNMRERLHTKGLMVVINTEDEQEIRAHQYGDEGTVCGVECVNVRM